MGAVALAPIAPRLGKMLALLASDKDGEILASVAAIGRTLAAAGATWHDLAAAVTETPAVCRAPEPPRPHRPQEPKFTFSRLAPGDCRRLIAKIVRFENVTAWEFEFLGSIDDQLHRRPDKLLSPAQVKTLNAIWRKTLGAM